MGRLEGKVALISGGARGQGAVETELFSNEGAKVVFGDIRDDEGKQVEAKIRELGGDVTYIHMDATNEEDWQKAVALAESQYGKLDILVNNAGISPPERQIDITVEQWDAVMDINAKGVFLGTKHAIPAMQRAGGGSIINTTSIRAMIGTEGADAYTSAKGGVVTLTRALALQWAQAGIRVNAIAPGVILTDRVRTMLRDDDPIRVKTPLGPSEPEDVAPLALYLASDESRQMTGMILPLDGGASAV